MPAKDPVAAYERRYDFRHCVYCHASMMWQGIEPPICPDCRNRMRRDGAIPSR